MKRVPRPNVNAGHDLWGVQDGQDAAAAPDARDFPDSAGEGSAPSEAMEREVTNHEASDVDGCEFGAQLAMSVPAGQREIDPYESHVGASNVGEDLSEEKWEELNCDDKQGELEGGDPLGPAAHEISQEFDGRRSEVAELGPEVETATAHGAGERECGKGPMAGAADDAPCLAGSARDDVLDIFADAPAESENVRAVLDLGRPSEAGAGGRGEAAASTGEASSCHSSLVLSRKMPPR